jgi:hypothetical protein
MSPSAEEARRSGGEGRGAVTPCCAWNVTERRGGSPKRRRGPRSGNTLLRLEAEARAAER